MYNNTHLNSQLKTALLVYLLLAKKSSFFKNMQDRTSNEIAKTGVLCVRVRTALTTLKRHPVYR